MQYYARIEHGDYYRDRWSEEELRSDFPGDEILIEGLHAMQVHFYHNNVSIEIPVVKVMNAAHYLAAYMFQTTCSGDRLEYDTLAYCSVGHDKNLMAIAMVVLVAMLRRTEGFRANQCRNLILEDRNEDFYEGVTLYEQFLDSAEERFAEEDFLIDLPAVMEQMKEKDEIIYQQAHQIQQLQYTITTMEEKLNNTQINIGQQIIIGQQTNTYYATTTATAEETTAQPEQPSVDLFKYIHPSVVVHEERIKIHLEVQNLVRNLSLPDICRYLVQMKRDNKVYLNVKPEAMFEELHRLGMPDEETPGFSKKNFMNYFNVN